MLDFVLNFLFPPVCGICGKLDNKWICNKCKKRLEKYERFKLIREKEEIIKIFKFSKKNEVEEIDKNSEKIKNGKLDNKENPIENIYFDEFLYCFEYKNLIRNLLLKYKFSDYAYLSNMFGNVILNNKKINEIFKIYDIIIPVPMDKIKKARRGYNQTELITKYFEKTIELEKDYNFEENKSDRYKKYNQKIIINNKCLFKIKNTKTQSTLSSSEREENIKNAFCVKNEELKNKKVILFDDIATTGSTVNEVSRILKIAGVNKILVLVIAKD